MRAFISRGKRSNAEATARRAEREAECEPDPEAFVEDLEGSQEQELHTAHSVLCADLVPPGKLLREASEGRSADRQDASAEDAGPHSASAPQAEAGQTDRLPHLSGARCLVALWIVVAHSGFWFQPRHPTYDLFTPFVWRARVGVCFFIQLSGFITHHAYGQRAVAGTAGSLGQFYARRFGRVLVSTWLSMAVALLAMQFCEARLTHHYTPGQLARCFLFAEAWQDPPSKALLCPNFPAWTISAMIPSWLLYPVFTRHVLELLECLGFPVLVGAAVALYVASFGHTFVDFIIKRTHLTLLDYSRCYYWPASQLADFALGACAAALARCRPPEGRMGLIGDFVLFCVVLICTLVPPEGGAKRTALGYETLFCHGFALAIAFYLYSSTAQSSLSARLFRNTALVALGEYSFAVYLWQAPIHYLFQIVREFLQLNPVKGPGAPVNHHTTEVGHDVWAGFVLCIWIWGGLYTELFEARLQRVVRHATKSWSGQPLFRCCSCRAISVDAYMPLKSMRWAC